MKTQTTQNISNLHAVVVRYLADQVIANMAVQYEQIGNRVNGRNGYKITARELDRMCRRDDAEMAAIASEVASYVRIPSEQAERFLVALAKAKKPAVKLELPACEGLEVRNPRTYRPWAEPMFETVAPQVAVMADWSPVSK